MTSFEHPEEKIVNNPSSDWYVTIRFFAEKSYEPEYQHDNIFRIHPFDLRIFCSIVIFEVELTEFLKLILSKSIIRVLIFNKSINWKPILSSIELN